MYSDLKETGCGVEVVWGWMEWIKIVPMELMS